LFPSGLGLNVGVILNSGKLSLLLVLGTVLILLIYSKRRIFRPNYIDGLIINFITWLLLGAFFAAMLNLGGLGGVFGLVVATLMWALSYFSFYFIGRLINHERVELVFRGLLYILLVCAAIGIAEFIFQTNFYGVMGKQLGLIDAGSGGELWRGGLYRVRSSLDQPLAFGYAMLCGYVLTDFLVKTQNIKWGDFIKALFVIMVFLSGSRSTMLVALICILAINYSRISKVTKWVLALMMTVFLYLLVSNLDKIFYVDKSFLAGRDSLVGRSGNLIGRFQDIEFVVRAVETSPFLGLGSGMLHNDSALTSYYPTLAPYYDNALDNMVLSLLVENGVLGVLMAIICVAGVSWYCHRLHASPEKRFLALMLFIFVVASLSYDLLIFPGVGRLMLLLIALTISFTQNCKPNTLTASIFQSNAPRPRVTGNEQQG